MGDRKEYSEREREREEGKGSRPQSETLKVRKSGRRKMMTMFWD